MGDMKQIMEGVLTTLESRQLADKLTYGEGDVCAKCSNAFVGWGHCRDCGRWIQDPESRCRCGANVRTTGGVCGPCVDARVAVCRCPWVWRDDDVTLRLGFHYRSSDNKILERCPTYWRDFKSVKTIELEKHTTKKGQRLSPGSYRCITTYNVDPEDKTALIATADYQRIFVEEDSSV